MSADRPNWATAQDISAWLRDTFPAADPSSLVCVDNALKQIQDAGRVGEVNQSTAAQMLGAAAEVPLLQVTKGNPLMSAVAGETLAEATLEYLGMSSDEKARWADPTTQGAQRAHRRLLRFSGNA